jgi:hypothetical protein
MKTLSIVIPVYYNELNLPDTIPQILGLSEELTGYHLELVLVNLTRNFGSMAAISASMNTRNHDSSTRKELQEAVKPFNA